MSTVTVAGVLSAIAGLGSIAALLTILVKAFTKSTTQKNEEIDKQIQKERTDAEETGRPI